jgi:hypothetical protein
MSRRARAGGALALLEREEERALAELKQALIAAGEDQPALEDMRALARRHPELTLAAGAALGVALAPLLGRLGRTVLPALLSSMRSGGARSLFVLMTSSRSPSSAAERARAVSRPGERPLT